MEEPKERDFCGGPHVAGMCLPTHAKWQKGYLLRKLKGLAVRGPHRENGMASMPEGRSDRCGSSEKDSSRVSRRLSLEVIVKTTLLQRASCQAEERGWKCLMGHRGCRCSLTQELTKVP